MISRAISTATDLHRTHHLYAAECFNASGKHSESFVQEQRASADGFVTIIGLHLAMSGTEMSVSLHTSLTFGAILAVNPVSAVVTVTTIRPRCFMFASAGPLWTIREKVKASEIPWAMQRVVTYSTDRLT